MDNLIERPVYCSACIFRKTADAVEVFFVENHDKNIEGDYRLPGGLLCKGKSGSQFIEDKILEETDINLHGLSVVCVSTDVKEYAQYVHIIYGHFLTEDEVRALVTTSTHHHWIDIFSLADYSLCFSQQEKIIDIIQSAIHS